MKYGSCQSYPHIVWAHGLKVGFKGQTTDIIMGPQQRV